MHEANATNWDANPTSIYCCRRTVKLKTKVFGSIIIPVFNQLEYTKKCLDSLLRDTDRPPYEIIVIENGSSDGTREYLEQKSRDLEGSQDWLIPIFNETNHGVAIAWNQGLVTASGKFIAVLNNDIVLTNGWFRSLLWSIEHHRLALVSGFAETGDLNYDLEQRAIKFVKKNLHKIWLHEYDFSNIVLLRSTYEHVGPFDENFHVGGYEDTDYCYRLRAQNLRFGVSGAAFIHHYGSKTLNEFKQQGDKHVTHNREYFYSKWKEDPSVKACSFVKKLTRAARRWKLNLDWM